MVGFAVDGDVEFHRSQVEFACNRGTFGHCGFQRIRGELALFAGLEKVTRYGGEEHE